MNDTISRAAAIDAICEDGTRLERQGQYSMTMAERKQRDADIIDALPSAQPYTADIQKIQDLEQAEIEKAFELGREDAMSEIIHCKDCKYHKSYTLYGQNQVFCNRRGLQTMEFDDYCSRAERREENG